MNEGTRQALFFIGCVPLRVALVVFAKKSKHSNVFLAFTTLVAIGFLVQHVLQKRIGAFGETVYWNRIAHSLFYAAFSVSYALEYDFAWTILAVDLAFGLLTFAFRYL